jgi:hypothetical protein
MSADEVAEVLPFLEDSRADVRQMAAEGVAGFTATPEGTAALTRADGLYPRLVALLSRAGESGCGEGAAAAAAALVNLSQQPAERLKLLDVPGAVGAAAACVAVDEPPELAEYASMLILNATQLSRGIDLLLAAGGARGDALAALLPHLAAPIKPGQTSGRLAHLALVLTNVTQHTAARAALLDVLSGAEDGAPSTLFEALCAQLSQPDATRRTGVTRALRNLSFAIKPDEADQDGERARANLVRPAVIRTLVARLAARLAVRNAVRPPPHTLMPPAQPSARTGAFTHHALPTPSRFHTPRPTTPRAAPSSSASPRRVRVCSSTRRTRSPPSPPSSAAPPN